MSDWRYWREPAYWQWKWRKIGSDTKAVLAVFASFAFGGLGFVLASGLSDYADARSISVYETTVLRTLTATSGGRTVARVVPVVRTVRIASARTYLTTATQALVRTITTPGGSKVVTEAVTTKVPVVRRVLVTMPGPTRTRVETNSRTVTDMRTETVTRTQTVAGAPVTQIVVQPPVTQTTTVTVPLVIVTVTMPSP